jgi:hypothetical protein
MAARASAPELSEAAFQRRILDFARLTGWIVYHTHDSRKSEPGFPDLVGVNAEQQRIIYVELKSDRGRLTGPQRRWLDKLARAGAETAMWRPADWDEAVAVLRGKLLPVPSPDKPREGP